MGDLNVPREAADVLKAIDVHALSGLIDQCVQNEQSLPIRTLQLDRCGAYVASRLRAFEQALAAHRNAKAAKKCAETAYDVRTTGSDLAHAVQQMQDRVATEERESQLFYVDDNVMPPFSFSEKFSVRISYRWRASVEDQWSLGSIVFSHKVVSQPYDVFAPPSRKSSVAKQKREHQDDLFRAWEYLKNLGLHSVREHFRRGGSGATIPQAFQAKTDPHTQQLNNFSAEF